MAKIIEDIVIIKLSKLVKDNEETHTGFLSDDALASLEVVVQELVGSNVIVEVATDNGN